MLAKFSCRNFRSVGLEPLLLDMLAYPRITKCHPDHVCKTGDASVLRNAAVYGANAAGKSSLVRAIDFMKTSVTRGALPQGTTREYCRAKNGFAGEETVFEVQFTVGERAYDYGFGCLLRENAVTSEWLYELGEQPASLFTRDSNGAVDLGEAIDGRASDAERTRLSVYKEDFEAQASSRAGLLFLTAVGKSKTYAPGSPLEALSETYGWFEDMLHILGAGMPSPTSDFYASDKTLDEVADVLASFDTGVESLSKRSFSMDELEKHVDLGLAAMIRQVVAKSPQPVGGGKTTMTFRSGDTFIGVEKGSDGEPALTVLEIRHSGSSLGFDFSDESDGTKRLFDFMDILFSRRRDAVFVVDEIDRSLHPMLTKQLVELFNEVHSDDECQLVFTTHESGIMTYDLLRKDEIWFVDRDEAGLSRLYSLNDFDDVRSDARLSKRYLEGRYGGVPVLAPARALAALQRGEEEK